MLSEDVGILNLSQLDKAARVLCLRLLLAAVGLSRILILKILELVGDALTHGHIAKRCLRASLQILGLVKC